MRGEPSINKRVVLLCPRSKPIKTWILVESSRFSVAWVSFVAGLFQKIMARTTYSQIFESPPPCHGKKVPKFWEPSFPRRAR